MISLPTIGTMSPVGSRAGYIVFLQKTRVVVVGVDASGKHNLLLLAEARSTTRFLPGPAQCRQQKRPKNGYDGNDDQQLSP